MERLQVARSALKHNKPSQDPWTPKITRWMKVSQKHHKTIHKDLIDQIQKELDAKSVTMEEADLLGLTLDWVNRSFSPAISKNITEAKLIALNSYLGRGLSHLFRLAQGGDPLAIKAYVILVRENVNNLNMLTSKHSELIHPISRRCLNWPARISKRRVFGDDADELIRKLEVGKDTIANDPASRFNPNGKFGKVAWTLIQRIEDGKTLAPAISNFGIPPSWVMAAKELSAFNRKATLEQKKKWMAVVEQLLADDFCNPKLAESYQQIITARSHKKRWKVIFMDKIRGEFDSLWGMHRRVYK